MNGPLPRLLTPPPASLAQLRLLVADLRSGGAGPRIGDRALATLDAIVAAPQVTAISSISELAAANGVNASTLTRLAQRLGYSGFNALQDVFRQQLSDGERTPVCAHGNRDAGRLANEEIDNIRATLDSVDPRELARLTGRIAGAQRVRVAGANATQGLAALLVHGLNLLRDEVAQLAAGGDGPAWELAHLNADDLVIVLSIAPHSRATLDLVRAVTRLKLTHVVLCDARDTRLSARAAQVLVCRGGGTAFPAATASMTLVIEALLVGVLRGLDARGRRELLRRQRLVVEHDDVALPAAGSAPTKYRRSSIVVRP